jgi:CBS domain-containing protein
MNIIAERLVTFIIQHPPFDLLSVDQVNKLAAHSEIRYHEQGEILFREGELPGDFFYMVRQGQVKIYIASEQNRLIDRCDEGDIFGVRPLIAKEPYLATAEVEENALLYALPVTVFESFLETNPRVSLYLAAGFASGKPAARKNFVQASGGSVFSTHQPRPYEQLQEMSKIKATRSLVTCSMQSKIKEAAQLMSESNSSAIIVTNTTQLPLGIITDTDLRKKVATGKLSLDSTVTELMNAPVYTIDKNANNGEAMVAMMQRSIHHLCITEDGSAQTPCLGLLSDQDLLLAEGRSPAALLRGIKSCGSTSEISDLLGKADQLVSGYIDSRTHSAYISGVMAAINDTVLAKCIEMATNELGQAPVGFCWLSLGSAGREEQIIRTDQDNALVYEDNEAIGDDFLKTYFLEFAQKVNGYLADCGFEYDPAGIMAGNHRWCNKVSEWSQLFGKWIKTPDEQSILLSTIFFDFRAAYGKKSLAATLSENLYQALSQQPKFLSFMAKDALTNPPPLSFFRNFLVEKSGEHKDQFDLKLRAMLPLVDAGRVLCLHHKIKGVNNTPKRFKAIAELEPSQSELFLEAALSYEILVGMRAKSAIENRNSGRYISPERFQKLERQSLKNIFEIIAELQKLLEVRFQLNYLR